MPRGGRSLIERITAESKVPLFKHLEGICHTYVHAAADPEMARRVVFNAKMRRPGICGATETLLVDRAVAPALLPPILDDLIAAGCEVRGDAATRVIDSRVAPAGSSFRSSLTKTPSVSNRSSGPRSRPEPSTTGMPT